MTGAASGIGRAVALPDVCGVAPCADEGFLLSSGHGVLAWHQAQADGACAGRPEDGPCPARGLPEAHATRHALAWDNHLRRV